jgi:hypothetical protein
MSDHLSGPRALADPAIDITDFYAFPSPSVPAQLVLVMNLFPYARPPAFFSTAAKYRFRLRPVNIPIGRTNSLFDVGTDEYALTCTFAVPVARDGREQQQQGMCILPNGGAVSFRVNDEQGSHTDGVRIFAGLRLDPYFVDLARETETRSTRRFAFRAPGTNTWDGLDVLSIVVELDVDAVLGPAAGTLFAVEAETLAAGRLPMRLERVGRPAMKNIVLSENGVDEVNHDLNIRDLYNEEDAFELGLDRLGAYRARLNANLALLDRLDGKIDWPLNADGSHPLTELLLADFLVVDVAKPYAEDSYFEIERALLQGRAHETCGGRSLNDDVVDTMYTLFVTGGNGPRVGDGVDQATVRAGRRFPYLAPANPNPPDRQPVIGAVAAAR